ncbi:MAG: type II CRISPR RNA-guided endonuclease Cas9 [Lachnospiraceae bacterium]
MNQNRNYRIGLDIGIASVGWAAVETDAADEPRRILDLGVRIFEAAEIPKTGEPLAKPRREARTTRRRLRRRHHRLERIKQLFEQAGLISVEEFEKRFQSTELPDVYELRVRALDERISDAEFTQILYHIAKHRGFRSTRKAEMREDKEMGAVSSAVKENEKRMKENGYRTVGEMIYKDEAFRENAPWRTEHYILAPRNRQGDYKHTILRKDLEAEVKTLFEAQRTFGNEKLTLEFEEQFLQIMLGQRSFDKGPGNQPDGTPSPYAGDLIEKMVGNCTLEPKEKRASKYTYTAERFVVLEKINHLKLVNRAGESRALTSEEREKLLALAYAQKEVKYAAVRKKLNLSEMERFKGLSYGYGKAEEQVKKVEAAVFLKMSFFHDMKKIFPELTPELAAQRQEQLDQIGQILTLYKGDESRRERLKTLGLADATVEELLYLNPSKFQHLSLKAMKKILPYLEQGFVYNEACEQADYDFKGDADKEKSEYITGDILKKAMEDIPNPVVKRSISQTVKVLNAIIRKYGSPQAVHIELAREMSKNYQERQKIEKEQKKNQERNEDVVRDIRETFGLAHPTGQDILKYRLWKDQNELCMYSGEHISAGELFQKGEVDIDHIVPYSICFDDSYHNKVLVKSKYNREKGNRLPYEYFGQQEERWKKFELLVENYIRDARKRQLLLKHEFTEEERKAFRERNLTDTKYITRVVFNLIRNHLKMADYMDPQKKQHVFAVNGAITSYMRKRWGLMQKDRSTDRHHAMDAAVIACCTPGMIQKISRNVQGRELAYAYDFQFPDEETGEIIDRSNFSREEWDEKYGVQIPKPWKDFNYELTVRLWGNFDSIEQTAEQTEADFWNQSESQKNDGLKQNPEVADVYQRVLGMDAPNLSDCEKNRLVLQKIGYTPEELDEVHSVFVSRMPKHKVTGAGHADTIRSPRYFEEDGIVLSKTALCDLKLDAKTGEIKDYYAPESDRLLYEAIKRQLQLHGNDGKKAFPEGVDFHKPRADGTEGPVVRKVKTSKKQSMGVYVNDKTGIAENGNGSMVRVDIFRENGKYYMVPIYTSDTKKKELPNRAVVANKPYSQWKEMKEENFLFSLYSRDLVKFKHKKGMNATDVNENKLIFNEQIVYYISSDIAGGKINGCSHDRSFSFRGLGIQSLDYLKKYQVDVLGNISEVKKEKRMRFH